MLCVNPFHHQMVRFVWGCFNQCEKWSYQDCPSFVQRGALCKPFIATKWLDLFEAASICVKSGPAWAAWALSKDAQFMLWSFVNKGVMLICDKALSSKYVYSLEDYKHILISIIFTKDKRIVKNLHFF